MTPKLTDPKAVALEMQDTISDNERLKNIYSNQNYDFMLTLINFSIQSSDWEFE